MLSCPLQIQLTGAGLQPFKGKELTFPFACMTKDQRDFLFGLLGYDDASVTWNRFVGFLRDLICFVACVAFCMRV